MPPLRERTGDLPLLSNAILQRLAQAMHRAPPMLDDDAVAALDYDVDALRELKLRGDTVAVLLADYRMPQMNGIEFLEQAMDLFPRARRALLTGLAAERRTMIFFEAPHRLADTLRERIRLLLQMRSLL